MFTGIITHLGKLVKKDQSMLTFQIDKSFSRKIEKSTSVAVNGVCLTVNGKTQNTFSITIMPETDKKTMFGTLQKHDLVNLELPVTPETLLSGHIVQGHVDGVGKVKKITEEGNSRILTLEIPEVLNKHIVEKGSIAVNGISLTVIKSEKTFFTVGVIPYTWKHTMLQKIKVGDVVNIETDILGKYVDKLLMHKNI